MQYDIRTLLYERRKLKKENIKNIANSGNKHTGRRKTTNI